MIKNDTVSFLIGETASDWRERLQPRIGYSPARIPSLLTPFSRGSPGITVDLLDSIHPLAVAKTVPRTGLRSVTKLQKAQYFPGAPNRVSH
jgi:hypothetical protein